MPETDLERVARAIDPLSWKIIDEHTSDNPPHPADLRLRIRMFNQAAAVLQALLTPSEGMIEAAARAITNYDDPDSWEKMYETLGDGERDGWARSRGVEMPCRVEARDSIRAALTAAIQFALNIPQELIMPNAADILKLPYARVITPEEDGSFRAEILEFPGCIALGDTSSKALGALEDVATGWLEATIAKGLKVPPPKTGKWTWNEGLPVNLEQKEG